jgi:Ser/Thr protein kinase RdoA (MazF antagonist)
MTDARVADLRRCLAEQYSLEALRVDRIAKGLGTQNWRVTTKEAQFFLKSYPSVTNLADEEAGLHLGEYARKHGVPTPALRPTRGGDLICRDVNCGFSLFEFVDGATSGTALDEWQMARAGSVLGRIHSLFRDYHPCGPAQTPRWLSFDAHNKAQELGRYLEMIDAKPQPDAFDVQTRPLLIRRKALLTEAARLLEELPPLTTQVLHNDYSSPNLLFRGTDLVGVVDFRPPDPFLISYELGRIALIPENLDAEDWIDRALAVVKAYCVETVSRLDDVRFAPHIWLVQLIRSTYGVKQHYGQPLEYQEELDAFWFRRARAVELIRDHLEQLEERFVAIWNQAH